MGIAFSSNSTKKTTYDLLEHLDYQIRALDNGKVNTELRNKKIVRHLVVYSSGIYMTLAMFVYIKLLPSAVTIHKQFLLLLPFLVIPALVYGVKRSISWWFQRQMMKNETKRNLLKEKKAKILEDVMENESYKVAMQILEKFGKPQTEQATDEGEEARFHRQSHLARFVI